MMKIYNFSKVKVITQLEKIQDKQLPIEDILNFDNFYKKILKNQIIRLQGKKRIVQKIYTPNIDKIMLNKVGTNFMDINRFLYHRKDNLKEAEIIYCLKNMLQQNKLDVLERNGMLEYINSLSGKIQFQHPNNISELFLVNERYPFLSLDNVQLIVKNLSETALEIHQSSTKEENEIEDLARAFIEACKFPLNKIECNQYLLRIRKIIMKNLQELQLQTLIEYLQAITKNRDRLFTESFDIQEIDQYLSDNYEALNLQNKLTVIEHLAMIKFQDLSNTAYKFMIEFKKTQFNIYEIAKIASSYINLYPKEQDFWNKLIEDFIKELYIIKPEGVIGEISLIFQSLQSVDFEFSPNHLFTIQNVVQDVPIEQSYTIKFQLLQQFTKLSIRNQELSQQVINYELSSFEFKYLQKYSVDKSLEVIKIFLLNDPGAKAIKLLIHQFNYVYSNLPESIDYFTRYDIYIISQLFLDLIQSNDEHFKQQIKKLSDLNYHMGSKFDRYFMKKEFPLEQGMQFIGLILSFKLQYKRQAFQKLKLLIKSRLQEQNPDQLVEHFVNYKVNDEELINELLNIMLSKKRTFEELFYYAQQLKSINGKIPERLDLHLIERALLEMRGLNFIYPLFPNYQRNLIFKRVQ